MDFWKLIVVYGVYTRIQDVDSKGSLFPFSLLVFIMMNKQNFITLD